MKHKKILSTEERRQLVQHYMLTGNYDVINAYGKILLEIASRIDDEEIEDSTLKQLLVGLFDSKIKPVSMNLLKPARNEVIAVCALHNSAQLIEPYVEHYKSIGVCHFVFIDNNSTDDSIAIMKNLSLPGISVDVWSVDDRFDSFKAMGWKQRMFVRYGLDRWYLNLDIDEHFVYSNHEEVQISSITKNATELGDKVVGSILIDMYPNADITHIQISDTTKLKDVYVFFDKNTYTAVSNQKYNYRIFGGPRSRTFGRHPSLQKYPLAFVSADMIAVNPHFWYPYSINQKVPISSAMLHYKFLPGDVDKYREYVRQGVHWDNSSQYRSYIEGVDNMESVNFFSKEHSIRYVNSSALKMITVQSSPVARRSVSAESMKIRDLVQISKHLHA